MTQHDNGIINKTSQTIKNLETLSMEFGDDILNRELRSIKTFANLRLPKLVVIGEVSSGKSHLINSLIDSNYLPTRETSTTTCTTIVSYGNPENTIFQNNGKNERLDYVDRDILLKLYKIIGKSKSNIRIGINSPWLQKCNGLQIVDTPGLNNADENIEEQILADIVGAVGIVFVTPATQLGSRFETDFIEEVSKTIGTDNLFLSVSKLSKVNLDERINLIQDLAKKSWAKKMNIWAIDSKLESVNNLPKNVCCNIEDARTNISDMRNHYLQEDEIGLWVLQRLIDISKRAAKRFMLIEADRQKKIAPKKDKKVKDSASEYDLQMKLLSLLAEEQKRVLSNINNSLEKNITELLSILSQKAEQANDFTSWYEKDFSKLYDNIAGELIKMLDNLLVKAFHSSGVRITKHIKEKLPEFEKPGNKEKQSIIPDMQSLSVPISKKNLLLTTTSLQGSFYIGMGIYTFIEGFSSTIPGLFPFAMGMTIVSKLSTDLIHDKISKKKRKAFLKTLKAFTSQTIFSCQTQACIQIDQWFSEVELKSLAAINKTSEVPIVNSTSKKDDNTKNSAVDKYMLISTDIENLIKQHNKQIEIV